jgi:hypothetical protein
MSLPTSTTHGIVCEDDPWQQPMEQFVKIFNPWQQLALIGEGNEERFMNSLSPCFQ